MFPIPYSKLLENITKLKTSDVYVNTVEKMYSDKSLWKTAV